MTNGQKLEELKSIARTRALTDHELRQLLEFYVAASSDGAVFTDSEFDDNDGEK
jgi:hypothetical protein